MRKIRVMLADDHAILRAGLRTLIQGEPDLEVVGEADSGPAAVELAKTLRPEVVVMDLTMPGFGGIKAADKLRQDGVPAKVLVLTMHDDPAYLRAALAAGCAGYLVKTADLTDLLHAIRAVHGGATFVDGRLRSHVRRDTPVPRPRPRAADTPASASAAHLTTREREVLIFLALGHSYQQIADRLFISVKTIETYRTRLSEKLGLRARADLVRYALEMGLLDPEAAE
jgi:DNA-binding NarL/FixJ family response regulator